MDTNQGIPIPKLQDIDQAINYTTALLRINDLTSDGTKVLLTCFDSYENALLMDNDLQDYRQKTGIYQDHKGYAFAEFIDSNKRRILVSTTPTQSLEGLQGNAIISQVSALVRSFRACYQDLLNTGDQIAHLHLTPERFDALIYENNELIAYTFDIFDSPDEIAYLTGLTTQFTGPQARWRRNLSCIIVSGHTGIQSLPMAKMDWLDEIKDKAEVKQFDTNQLYLIDEISDLKRKTTLHNQAISRTASLVPMVGAILSHQDNYGGDFLQILSREVKAERPNPLQLILQMFAKSSQVGGSVQFQNPVLNYVAKNTLPLSFIASLVIASVLFGIKYQQLTNLDTQLNSQLAIEKKRETDNKKTEDLTLFLRQRLETMKKRVEIVNTKKPDQIAPFTIFNSIINQIPSPTPGNPPITLTEMNLAGRDITITGYTRNDTPEPSTPTNTENITAAPTPPSQPTVMLYDESQTVRGFVTNLKGDTNFTNVQIEYANNQKNKFTVTLQYTREIPSLIIEGEPIPDKIIQAAPDQLTSTQLQSPKK